MKTISDGKTSVSFDRNGLIDSLKTTNGYEWVQSPGLWRIIYSKDENLEIELLASDISLSDIIISTCEAYITHESEFLKVTIKTRIEDGVVIFDAEIKNKTNIVIREFQFPYFNLGRLSSASLLLSSVGGKFYRNMEQAIISCHTGYKMQENKAIQMNCMYPGEAATNCFAIFCKNQGLYFGSHDASFQDTLHHFRSSEDGIRALIVKYPFIKCNESKYIEGFTIAPIKGDWHEAAKIYRKWANSWFKPSHPPQWIRNFNGWQRLIMRHQYGETFFKYTDLPSMYLDGAKVGIDNILLFAWWTAGMDAGYPNYTADKSQGGFNALKNSIQKVRKQGGKIILYFNGHLIDKSTDFYKRIGYHISIKNADGIEHTETYNFGGAGTALYQFGNRFFSTACFSCQEWIDVLKSCIDIAVELDVDGIFYDVLGYKLWPCSDLTHGHPIPDMNGFETKAKVIKALYDYAKSRKPELAFGTEWLSDRLAPQIDFFHSLGCYGKSNNGIDEHFVEWFRYCFPEVTFSDRLIRDDKDDFKRRVNHAIQLGLKSDVEIFRCRATIAAAPKYAEYLAKANALRQELREFIFYGKFIDDTGLKVSNSNIFCKAFKTTGKLLVVATHRLDETQSGSLEVQNFKYETSKGLGNFKVIKNKEGCTIELPADSLVAMLFSE